MRVVIRIRRFAVPKSLSTTDIQNIEPLLVRREETMRLLNCSYSHVKELERLGKLTVIKLSASPASVVHHRLSEVRRLAGEGGE
jgi:hypothetical protein